MLGFFRCHNELWCFRRFCVLQAFDPFRLQYIFRVLQFTGGRYHHIAGGGDSHYVVAEFKRELTTAEELLVLPPFVICVRNHSGKPLSDFVDVVFIIIKEFVSSTGSDHFGVDDVVGETDLKVGRHTRH